MTDGAHAPPPCLSIRWSEHEARKAYARPFGVTFRDHQGAGFGAIAVSGADLLYYRQFQEAVLSLAGELFRDPRIEGARDPQHAWLDVLANLLPPLEGISVAPRSCFDPAAGRIFRFAVSRAGVEAGHLEAALILSYQDFQAAVAHQFGALYRNIAVEAVADPAVRQAAWVSELSELASRPAADEAMAAGWPWR